MKKTIIIILTSIAVSILFYFIFNTVGCKQKEKIAVLEEQVEFLKSEYVPIRFKVLDRKNDNLNVAVKFYDADGKVIKRINKNLIGDELSFDFYVIPIKERYIAFPYKIFSDKIAPDDGEILTKYYDNDGFPQTFHSKKMNKKLKGGLKAIFEKIKNDDFSTDDKYFGNMVHDISELKEYKTGHIYRIVCRVKGGIEVIEE